jgi:hypothetical protein
VAVQLLFVCLLFDADLNHSLWGLQHSGSEDQPPIRVERGSRDNSIGLVCR